MGHRSKKPGGRLCGLAATAALLTAVLSGCGGGTDGGVADLSTAGKSKSSTPVAVSQPLNTEGRLLASNCFQCHGTLGLGGFDKIRGGEASEVREFTTKNASRDIMAAHAQGYTPEQLKKIIAYLQQ